MKITTICLGLLVSTTILGATPSTPKVPRGPAPMLLDGRPLKPYVPPKMARPDTRETAGQSLLRQATGNSTSSVISVPFRKEQASYVSVGPGLVIYEGEYAKQSATKSKIGLSANIGYVKQWNARTPIFVGADLALHFWNYDNFANNKKLGILGIQLLPTAYYQFPQFISGVDTYFGLSIGPHLHLAQFSSTADNSYFSELTIYLQVMLRPGVTIHFAPDFALNLEPKFGILRSEPLFAPQITANLSL